MTDNAKELRDLAVLLEARGSVGAVAAIVAASEIERLRGVITRIAKQPLKDELEQEDEGDFEFAYAELIRLAREVTL